MAASVLEAAAEPGDLADCVMADRDRHRVASSLDQCEVLLEQLTGPGEIVVHEGHVALGLQEATDDHVVPERPPDLRALVQAGGHGRHIAAQSGDGAAVEQRVGEPDRIVELADDRLRLAIPGFGRLVVVQPIGDPGGASQALRPGRSADRRAGQREQPVDPVATLAEMAALLPEPPECEAQPEAELGVAGLDRPGERCPEVVMVVPDSVDRLSRPGQLGLGRHGQRHVVPGVETAGIVDLAILREPFEGELADRLEEQEARFAVGCLLPSDEALLDEGRQRLEGIEAKIRRPADSLGRFERPAADEHAETPEEHLEIRCEEGVAPVDRLAQRLLASRQVARSAAEEGESAAQPAEDRLGAEEARLRRRELDRQRQPVETNDDLGDRRDIGRGDREVRSDGHRPLEEQGDPLVLRERLHRRQVRRVGDPERWNGMLVLAMHVEHGPARHEDAQARSSRQQVDDDRRRVEDLLEVVEDEEDVAVAEIAPERLDHRPVGGFPEADRGADRRGHEVRVADGGELDEEDAVLVCGQAFGGDLQREARLACSAGPGQRDEAGPLEQITDRGDLVFATDEVRQLDGQVVRASVEGPESRECRRETGRLDLVDALRSRQVLETMRAELGEADIVREGLGEERARRIGQEDLASVPGSRDAGRAVNVETQVVVAAEPAFAGVEAHPDPDLHRFRPLVRGQRSLRDNRRPERVAGLGEHCEEAVALGRDLHAPAWPIASRMSRQCSSRTLP